MSEDEGTADATTDGQKVSKRNRFRGAISRTKSKFKKQQEDKSTEDDFKLPDDVDHFLQAGRPSTSDSLTDSINPDALPEHPSPRRVPIPRIDVSSSLRWPSQRPISSEEGSGFLKPEYQTRSHSHGPLSRKKNRPRNLSVSFLDAPPTVIGEGGDEAEAPTIEVARSRARSVSPMPYGRGRAGSNTQLPVMRKPIPAQAGARAHHSPEDLIPGRRTGRVGTGLAPPGSPANRTDSDREFEMTLQQPGSTPVSPNSPRRIGPRQANPIVSPTGPLVSPSRQGSSPVPMLKPAIASQDLRMQFEEGQVLREGRRQDSVHNSPASTESHPQTPLHHPQPQLPQLQQLSLSNMEMQLANSPGIFSPTRPESSKDDGAPSRWM